jgi:hypothetical protein
VQVSSLDFGEKNSEIEVFLFVFGEKYSEVGENCPSYYFVRAIANGYTILLQESTNMILELKDVVNLNGLSMTDHERMDIINYVYERLKEHRNLVSYYTRKNISVAYLRAKKAGDADRVVALYGNANDRYW